MLDRLALTEDEKLIAEFVKGIGASDLFNTWDSLPYNRNREFDSKAAYYRAVHDAVADLEAVEGLVSRDELELIAAGTHPHYANEAKTASDRLKCFFSELSAGTVFPSRLFSKWLEVLEEADGDHLKACVLAEFHRPAEAGASCP